MLYLAFRRPHFPATAKTSFKGWRAEMKTSLQNTLEDIKSKEDKDSDIPASRRTRRKLHLDDLLDKFEKAQASTRRNLEDREWLDCKELL